MTRLRNLLSSRKWNWCGFLTFYIIVAILGVMVVIVIHVTELMVEMDAIDQWATVLLGLPGLLTLLRAFSQVPTSAYKHLMYAIRGNVMLVLAIELIYD